MRTVVITGLTMHWWPDRIVTPPLEVAVAVGVVTALALAVSAWARPLHVKDTFSDSVTVPGGKWNCRSMAV